jgi:hypothetical protein
MGELADSGQEPDGTEGTGRRRFIAGVAAASGLAFAAPAIVTMQPAGASTLTSPPPKPPDPPVGPASPPAVAATDVADPPAAAPAAPAVAPVVASGQLPFTGASVKALAATGLAATAAGTAMVVWSAERAKNVPPDVTPPTTS